MKFNIKRELLANTLSDFALILKENPIKPILSGLKIEVKDNKIVFIGTNLESTLIRTVEGNIVEEGTVIVKPQLILEYVKLLEVETIEVSAAENSLKVHQAEFVTLNDEGYPKVKEVLPIEITRADKDILVNSLENVSFQLIHYLKILLLTVSEFYLKTNLQSLFQQIHTGLHILKKI